MKIMTNLYLIRHGEAVANVEPIIGGMKGDVGLTALGQLQAERLRDRLAATKEFQADILIASTLPRAKQTAETIAPALGLPLIFDDEVQELRPGEPADGMNRAEAEAKFGKTDFKANPFSPMFPGGENLGQFRLRVATALDRIIREHEGKNIVIVTHGGVVNASFRIFFGINTFFDNPASCFPHNASITQWSNHKFEDGSNRWYLISFNDTMHLRDISTGKLIGWEAVTEPVTGKDTPAVPMPNN
jgi:2,3-bisphosphoglycerate-dependent phosphoglycerate mutase